MSSLGSIDLATGNLLKKMPESPHGFGGLIPFGEDTNYFYTYNFPYNEISAHDIDTLEKVRTIKFNDFYNEMPIDGKNRIEQRPTNVEISPNARYLAGVFIKQELRGNQWTILEAYIRIFDILEDKLKLLHEEPLSEDDYFGVNIGFGKRSDMFFVTKKGSLYRYDITKDSKVQILAFKFNIADAQQGGIDFIKFNSVGAFGRVWDIETGRKISPYWEVMYPSDSSKIFPLYESTPSPISFDSNVRNRKKEGKKQRW